MALRTLVSSLLWASVGAATLALTGEGAQIQFGGNAVLESYCRSDVASIKFIKPTSITTTISSYAAQTVKIWLANVAPSCAGASLTTPCAVETSGTNAETDHPKLFYCAFSGPGGVSASTGPYYADRFIDTKSSINLGIGTYILCDLPSIGDILAASAYDGSGVAAVNVTVSFFAPAGSAGAVELPHGGVPMGNVLTFEGLEQPPPPSPTAPPPQPPAVPFVSYGGHAAIEGPISLPVRSAPVTSVPLVSDTFSLPEESLVLLSHSISKHCESGYYVTNLVVDGTESLMTRSITGSTAYCHENVLHIGTMAAGDHTFSARYRSSGGDQTVPTLSSQDWEGIYIGSATLNPLFVTHHTVTSRSASFQASSWADMPSMSRTFTSDGDKVLMIHYQIAADAEDSYLCVRVMVDGTEVTHGRSITGNTAYAGNTAIVYKAVGAGDHTVKLMYRNGNVAQAISSNDWEQVTLNVVELDPRYVTLYETIAPTSTALTQVSSKAKFAALTRTVTLTKRSMVMASYLFATDFLGGYVVSSLYIDSTTEYGRAISGNTAYGTNTGTAFVMLDAGTYTFDVYYRSDNAITFGDFSDWRSAQLSVVVFNQ